jgi:hypothetical protein
LYLPRRCSTTWAVLPILFALIIFQIGSPIYSLAQTGPQFSYLCFSHSWDDRCTLPCPTLLAEMGVSKTFCPDWSQTLIFLIPASWVAGIIGLSHWFLAWLSSVLAIRLFSWMLYLLLGVFDM